MDQKRDDMEQRKSAKKSVIVTDELPDVKDFKKTKEKKREVHSYAQEIMADLEYRQQFKVDPCR